MLKTCLRVGFWNKKTIVEYAHQANMMQFKLKKNYIHFMKNSFKEIRTETRRLVQL